MATDKPRFSITMDEELLDQVETFRHSQRLKTQSRAVIDLVKAGLAELEKNNTAGAEKASPYSDEALSVAEIYDDLDAWGKRAVRELSALERNRCEDEHHFLEMVEPERSQKIIPLFLSPSAAGYAAPEAGADFIPLEMADADPAGAEFAVRIQGDSMEPYIKDGSHVFCNHDPLDDGEVGIFAVDGETVCKQYHYDRALGITYLFSLNRKRSDADVVLAEGGGRSLVCLGRVMLPRRYPLPR